MRPNHDLRIILYDPSGSGGICHYTYQLAENLARVGSDVTVVTAEGFELGHLRRNFKAHILFKRSWIRSLIVWVQVQIDGTNHRGRQYEQLTVDHTGRPASKFNALLEVLKTLRLRLILLKGVFSFLLSRPAVIHFQWLVDRNEDYYFIKLLKLLRFKIVYTAHDLLPHEDASPDAAKAFKKIYQAADRLIVHAESNKKELISKFDIDPNKICIIPHGSYDLFYAGKNVAKETAREELGIPHGKRVILFFGLVRKYKGLEYLVDAFTEVKDKVAEVMLLVVGRIHSGDAEGFKYYSHLVDEIDGRDDVMCVKEYVPFERVGVYFSASDVVVLPYTESYQSGVLLAAYAAGRPVVVTDTGGLSEVVVVGKSGFVVPARDAHALAQAIVRVIKSPDQMEEMGRYAKYLAETTYSWRSVALKTIDVYRSLAPTC